VDQQHLLILSNDGVFSMIDFRSGETKFETKVPELENGATSGLIVNKFNGTYVVTVYSVKQQSEFVNQDDVRVTFQRMHKGNAMINGNIVALDAETGAAVWKRPVVVQRFQMLEGLPWDCPFLFLARRNTYEMIDIKSGKLKRNELFKVPVRDEVFYQVVCQPKFSDSQEQVIQLEVASLEAKLFLNDLPAPPQPVAALTNQGSFKRMKRETSSAPASLSLATDLGALIEEAIADEAQRVELGKEEVRLTEIEMQSK